MPMRSIMTLRTLPPGRTDASERRNITVPDIWKIEPVLEGGRSGRPHSCRAGTSRYGITDGLGQHPPISCTAVSARTPARYIEHANYLVWREHVQVVLNFSSAIRNGRSLTSTVRRNRCSSTTGRRSPQPPRSGSARGAQEQERAARMDGAPSAAGWSCRVSPRMELGHDGTAQAMAMLALAGGPRLTGRHL